MDRENASLYAEAGVKEYWIVLGSERKVEVYRQPENGRYQQMKIFGADEVLSCVGLPGVTVCLSEIFPGMA